MANIQKELNDILVAVFGEEVRGSIHDAISKINGVTESAIQEMRTYNEDLDAALTEFEKKSDAELTYLITQFKSNTAQALLEFNTYTSQAETSFNTMLDEKETEFDTRSTETLKNFNNKSDLALQQFRSNSQSLLDEITDWYEHLKVELDEDLGVRLTARVNAIDELLLSSKRSMYRGKNLGPRITSEQGEAIKNGTFEDLYIGDYWSTINGNFRIWDFNYYKWFSNIDSNKPHVIVVPDGSWGNAKMNNSASTSGGFANSTFHNTSLQSLRSSFAAAFGSDRWLLDHLENVSVQADERGRIVRTTPYIETFTLMDETMLFGKNIYAPAYTGNPEADGIQPAIQCNALHQLALPRLNPGQALSTSMWLKDVADAYSYSYYNRETDSVDPKAADSVGSWTYVTAIAAYW